VEWIDPEWPDALKKSLVKLWELYKSESIGRISDACAAADECYKLSQDKKELEEINNNMAEELQKTMTDRQVGSISKNLLDIQIFLKLKAEKQRDQLKEEKKRLENCIADLLKQAAVNKDKLDRLKQILDE
jgi:uncharacterized protein YpuA (DUF1002 family)